MNTECIFWVCLRVRVNSSSKTLMIRSGVFIWKVWHVVNTVHQARLRVSIDVTNTESTSPRPAVVLPSVGSEHGPPFKCKSLTRDVKMETALRGHIVFLQTWTALKKKCKYVCLDARCAPSVSITHHHCIISEALFGFLFMSGHLLYYFRNVCAFWGSASCNVFMPKKS